MWPRLWGSSRKAEPGSRQRVLFGSGAVPVLATIESGRWGFKKKEKKKNQRRTGTEAPPVCGDRGVTMSRTDRRAPQPLWTGRCPRSCPSSPFRGYPRGLLTGQPGAVCALQGRRRHRQNRASVGTKDAQTASFPQDTTLVHSPPVLGSVGARAGSGKGSAGLTVAKGRSRGWFAPPGGDEPWGSLPGPGTNPCLRLTTSSGQRPALPPPARSPPAASPVGARFWEPRSRVPPAERTGKGRREGMCRGRGD